MKAFLLASALVFVSLGSAHAGTVTVGSNNAGNCYPFSCMASDVGAGGEYQQVYGASSFSGTSIINSLSFYRLVDGVMDQATYSIYLSTTQKAVNGLSYDPAANRGSDALLFGTYSVGGTMPDVLTFSGNAFTYDATAGNLLLDVVIDSLTTGVGYESFFQADTYNGMSSRLYGVGGSFGIDGYSLVTTFGTADAAAVPEPESLALLGLGIAGLAAARRRKSR